MENFEVFLKNKWLKCPKPIISWYHSIVGITIKRLVHIAGLQINPSSQNLSSKFCSGWYICWKEFKLNSRYLLSKLTLLCRRKRNIFIKFSGIGEVGVIRGFMIWFFLSWGIGYWIKTKKDNSENSLLGLMTTLLLTVGFWGDLGIIHFWTGDCPWMNHKISFYRVWTP